MIELVLRQVVGDTVLIVGVETRPDLLEAVGRSVVEVGCRVVDIC